jgi:alpha-D-xyloside xylohydrolase
MLPAPYDVPDGYDRFIRVTSAGISGADGVLILQAESGRTAQMRISIVAKDIWQWSILPDGVTAPAPTGILVQSSGIPHVPEAHLTATTFIVSCADHVLRVGLDPFTFTFAKTSGTTLFRDTPGDIDGLGRPFVLPMGCVWQGSVVHQVVFSFAVGAEEHFFGLGEKFTPVDKKGQRIVSWTQDAFGSTGERSHKNIPFLMSSNGYALLIDTGARITWELTTRSCQSATVLLDASSFSGFLIAGDTPADILQRYTWLTGRAPMPPKWSFGLWVSSGGTYRDRASIERLIDGLEQHRIPADVVHVDPWWMKWRMYCDFRWDREAFPDPEGFIRLLHDRGFKLCLWEHPYISVESDLFAAGSDAGYFVKRPDGGVYIIDYGLSLAPRPDGVVREATPENSWNARVAIVDLSYPPAVAWFQELHRPLLKMGVDVFKTDFGEDIPSDAIFANGQTGNEMHNLYPLLYNSVVAEVTKQEKGNGLVWGRAGTAGSQRMPVCWSGDPAADFESLACTIRGGLSIGLSGVPFWSNDIGGYRGMPDPELYIRWAQFGLLCSHSRMHGDSPREPWHFGDMALSIVRRFIALRYALFPYLYSCAFEASRTGMPVVRAMPLAFPGDPNTYDKDYQYMLGPWLLVAPVIDRSGARAVYLPEGEWFDYWTGQMYRGPRTIRVTASLSTMPLFVRAGAILPTMIPNHHIPREIVDPLLLELYLADSSQYVLNEDEGETRFALKEQARGYLLEWSGPVARKMIFRIHTSQGKPEVRIGRAPMGALPTVATRTVNEWITEVEASSARQGSIALTTLRE